MLELLSGFEWDIHNVGHIARHSVSPEEVEEVTRRRHIIIPAASSAREERWKLFGRTAAGRYLVVVFTLRRKKFRMVTSYTMNPDERSVYATEIEG